MKSSLQFREQINFLVSWFDNWNDCEQIVALYTLLRKLSSGHQTKFLLQVLKHNVVACLDVENVEKEANSRACIKNLCQESKEKATQQLLLFFPLLKAGNCEAKEEYLKIIPQIIAHSIENKCHLEESKQLLSYCLIHPALSRVDRATFQNYVAKLNHLEETFDKENTFPQAIAVSDTNVLSNLHPNISQKINPKQQYHNRDSGIGVEPLQSFVPHLIEMHNVQKKNTSEDFNAITNSFGGSTVLGCIDQNVAPLSKFPSGNANLHKKLSRTSSIKQQNSNVCDWLNKHHNEMSTQQTTTGVMSEVHAPLSPQSSVSSSGSDSPNNDLLAKNTFLEDKSGMRDVPVWLKSLRLHKYSSLFQQMTYDDMLGLTEEWLASQNVTKGARHKIVLSIQKLKERQPHLRALEKDILEGCNIKQALQEIKNMLNTPIQGFKPADRNLLSDDQISEGDIPAQLTRVMGKLCTQLLVSAWTEEDCFVMYLPLLDKCMKHEAFTMEQKNKLASWKLQIQKIWTPSGHRQRKNHGSNSYALRNLLQGHMRTVRGQLHKQYGQPLKWGFTSHPLPVNPKNMSSAVAANNLPLYRHTALHTALSSRPPLYELTLKQQIGRTQSVPITKSHESLPVTDLGVMEPELAARLDSLCLSMTEHALGNLDSPEKGSTL